jgi:hypothetical protein
MAQLNYPRTISFFGMKKKQFDVPEKKFDSLFHWKVPPLSHKKTVESGVAIFLTFEPA